MRASLETCNAVNFGLLPACIAIKEVSYWTWAICLKMQLEVYFRFIFGNPKLNDFPGAQKYLSKNPLKYFLNAEKNRIFVTKC